MGFMKGAVSFSRFVVDGGIPPNYKEDFPGRIRRFGFRELDEHSDQERSVGWVEMMDPLDSEFQGEGFFKEGYMALGLRVDTRVVPAKVLRQHSLLAQREAAKREGLKFLTKERREEITEQVRWTLLRRTIPKSFSYEVVWNLKAGSILLASVQPAVCDLFAQHFQKTFGLKAVPLHPYEMILRQIGEKQGALEELSRLRAWEFQGE